ncbi:hypothetical protein ACH5RR_025225 [Cinchona calisaya]|uniref:Uncharacterized protein n=1 Tax=Cinchona calisaya TaxID=153742 RepID=A0ABD2Z421_9GENT
MVINTLIEEVAQEFQYITLSPHYYSKIEPVNLPSSSVESAGVAAEVELFCRQPSVVPDLPRCIPNERQNHKNYICNAIHWTQWTRGKCHTENWKAFRRRV